MRTTHIMNRVDKTRSSNSLPTCETSTPPVENVNETPGSYLNVLKCLVQKAVQVVQAQLSPPRIRENFFFSFVTVQSVRFSVYSGCASVLNLGNLKIDQT